MKKLILLVLIFSGIAFGYFEINDDVPGVFSPGGEQQWRMWAGNDAASTLFDGSSGILFDDVFSSIVVGKFTPGEIPANSVDVGYFAGGGNPIPKASSHTSVGYFSGGFNTADNLTSSGFFAGYFNTGVSTTFAGSQAGRSNDGDNNTAVGFGAFDTYTLDGGSAQTVASVDFANNQVTTTGAHGFGSNGDYLNLKMTTTGALPGGFVTGFQVWKIISSTKLELFTATMTDAGTGTHTLTPKVVFTDSTALGFNAEPDADYQVVLGDTNVTEVKTSGSLNIGGGITLGGNIIIPDDGLIGSVSDTDAIQIEADGDVVMSQGLAVDTDTLIVDAIGHTIDSSFDSNISVNLFRFFNTATNVVEDDKVGAIQWINNDQSNERVAIEISAIAGQNGNFYDLVIGFPSEVTAGAPTIEKFRFSSTGSFAIKDTNPASQPAELLSVFVDRSSSTEPTVYFGNNDNLPATAGKVLLLQGGRDNVDSYVIRAEAGAIGSFENAFEVRGDSSTFILGPVGVGEAAPETLTEWTSTAPYLTLHNNTEEDGDGGRESRINFKGEQSGTEETTLARIEVSHDGAADDEKGKLVISVNDGNDGDTPTDMITISADGSFTFGATAGITGLKIKTVTITNADHTAALTDDVILFSTGAPDRTLNLPTASTAFDATSKVCKIYWVKKIDAGAGDVILDGNGAETVDGGATATITVQYEAITLSTDGSNWHIL